MINYKQRSDIFSCPHKPSEKPTESKESKAMERESRSILLRPSTHHQAKSLKIQSWIESNFINVILLLSLAVPSLGFYKIYKTTEARAYK